MSSQPGENRGEHLGEFNSRSTKTRDADEGFHLLDVLTLINIYNALILPHLDYASVVWDGLDKGLAIKLQRLQNRAIRIITRSS